MLLSVRTYDAKLKASLVLASLMHSPVNAIGEYFEEYKVMRRALVVDDEPLMRRQVAEIVAGYGFDEILEAENGVQAVEIVAHQEVLLVVMDVGMPVMDGVTAAEKIGKIKPVPIVLVTANTEADTIERARLAGVMNYVVKPVRAEQLFAAVDLAIHQFVELSNLREEVAKLQETLAARKVIDRAKGVLMKRGMDEPGAFRRLQKLAMDKRKSLREVAEAILLTEE
jgi:AmiR/NasT family two-component response regulator